MFFLSSFTFLIKIAESKKKKAEIPKVKVYPKSKTLYLEKLEINKKITKIIQKIFTQFFFPISEINPKRNQL